MADQDRDKLGEQLSAFVDGELSAAESDAVRELLATSAAARRQYQELREVSQQLGALPRVSAPADLAALRDRWTTGSETQRPSFRVWRFAFWLQGGVGVAACVLLFFLGTWAGWSARRLVEPPATIIQDSGRISLSSGDGTRPSESSRAREIESNSNESATDKIVTGSQTGHSKDELAKSAISAPAVARVEPDAPAPAARGVIDSSLQFSPGLPGAMPVPDSTACVTLIISPANAADYRQAVATLNSWKGATQSPLSTTAVDTAAETREKSENMNLYGVSGRSVGRAVAGNNSVAELNETTLYLTSEQAVALKRDLDQPMPRNMRVQVDARNDQMQSIEPILTATINTGTKHYLGPQEPFSNYVKPPEVLPTESQPAEASPAAPTRGGRLSSPANKPEAEHAARKSASTSPASSAESMAAPGRAGGIVLKNAISNDLPKEADSNRIRQQPQMSDDRAMLMGPPCEPLQFLQMRITVLPPAELIEAAEKLNSATAPASRPASAPGDSND